MKDPEIELVDIATRSCDHYKHARLGLEAGKNVLLEKPACVTIKASFEKKKMIVNCLIRRVDVYRGYKLKIDFNIDFEQFMVGIDKVA